MSFTHSVCLLSTAPIQKAVGGSCLDIAMRILGLFPAAFGVQFRITRLADATIGWIAPSALDVNGVD